MLNLKDIFDPDPILMPLIGPDDLPGDWRMEFEERAAIREYEGGQAREHAEAEALSEIVGEMQRKGLHLIGAV